MTATTKTPSTESRPRPRPIRFLSMETLGFSNPSATWTDSPTQLQPARPPNPVPRRGRHEAPEPEPVTVADWVPEEFGPRLGGRNVRWSIVFMVIVALTGIAGVAYWLYQRPVVEAEASLATLSTEAERLRDVLPTLEQFGTALTISESLDSADLFVVDDAARSLFDASGNLSGSGSALRSSAATASTSALDGVRLAGDANSYRLAVTPILVAPGLETDPNLIELDEAARDFGDWQLRFDEIRTALPDQTMTATTEQLDILSGDLSGILSRYMDALQADDQRAAVEVLNGLGGRLAAIHDQMTDSLEEIQGRVFDRINEAETALIVVLES